MTISQNVIITSNPKTYRLDITYHGNAECFKLKRVKNVKSIPIEEARKKYKPCGHCLPRERSRWFMDHIH